MQETLNDIFAVIVLYKTTLEESATFKSLVNAVTSVDGFLHVLLYNNSPEVTLDINNYKTNVIFEVINDPANSGVSKAYNLAKESAKKRKRKWLLLLDQDTDLPENFFQDFFQERNNDIDEKDQLYLPIIYSNNKVISPGHYFAYRGFVRKSIQPGYKNLKKLAVINSGVIIHVSLFEKAGSFNEDVKLDFSDISFFRRVKKHYSLCKVRDVKCLHSFSSHDYSSYEQIINRFKVFNKNAVAFSKEKGVSKTLLFITVFVRALNLSLKFKSINFLREVKFH